MSLSAPSRLNIEIISWSPRISLMTAEPPETTLKVTCSGWPSRLSPSHTPGMFLIVAKAFCESVWSTAEAASMAARNINDKVRSDLGMAFSFLQIWTSFWSAGGVRLPGVLFFHKSFQVGQTGAPEAAILLDPGVDGAERFGVQL